MTFSVLDGFAVNLELWWSNLPRIERVAAAAAAGFRHAEIWFWPHWDIDLLQSECQRHDVAIAQIGGWDFEPRLDVAANRSAFRKGIADAVDVAQRLEAGRINLNGPILADGDDPAGVRRAIATALAEVVELAERADVTLMVEPMNTRVDHPGYALPDSTAVLEVCERVGSPALGINWDLYHLQIAEGDLSGHLEAGADRIAYVQVADHPGRHEPGTGEIDYAHVLGQVRAIGYDGPIGLECTPRDTPEVAVERLRRRLNSPQL